MEGRVSLEGLREVLGALRIDVVADQMERGEGFVLFETGGEVLDAVRTELVAPEIELLER